MEVLIYCVYLQLHGLESALLEWITSQHVIFANRMTAKAEWNPVARRDHVVAILHIERFVPEPSLALIASRSCLGHDCPALELTTVCIVCDSGALCTVNACRTGTCQGLFFRWTRMQVGNPPMPNRSLLLVFLQPHPFHSRLAL